MSTSTQSVEQKTLIVSITKKKIGIRRKVNRRSVEVKPVGADLTDNSEEEIAEVNEEVDQNLLHVTKDLYESAELEAIKVLYGRISNWIKTASLPAQTLKSGMYLIKATDVSKIESQLATFRTELAPLVEAFILAYPNLIAESKRKLGSLANDRDYPAETKIRSFFTIEWQYLTFEAPKKALQEFNQEILIREEEKIKAQWAGYAQQIESALIISLKETIQHFTEVLSPSEDGKQKKVTEKKVERFNGMIEAIMGKNVSGNEEINNLATLARDILNGNTTKEINDSQEVKRTIEEKMKEVTASLEQMIIEKESRRIVVEE